MSYALFHALDVLVGLLLQLAIYLVIAAIVLSWLIAFGVLNMNNPTVRQIVRGLDAITEPLFRPFRRIVPPLGGLDLSPVLVIIVLIVLQIFFEDFFGYLMRISVQ